MHRVLFLFLAPSLHSHSSERVLVNHLKMKEGNHGLKFNSIISRFDNEFPV